MKINIGNFEKKNWLFSVEFQKHKINNTLQFSCAIFSSKHGVLFSRKEILVYSGFRRYNLSEKEEIALRKITRIHIISIAFVKLGHRFY